MSITLMVDAYQSFVYVLYIYVKEVLIIVLSGSVDSDGRNDKKLEGVHVGFLQQVTGKKARRLGDDTWRKEGAQSINISYPPL